MSAYIVEFERIGRSHDVPPLTTTAESAAHLAEQVYDYARRFLGSKGYTVVVDLDEMSGSIEAGRFGAFTVKAGA